MTRLNVNNARCTALFVSGLQRSDAPAADAVAEVIKRAPRMKKSEVVIVNISGRGDKDVGILRENLKLN